MQVHALAKNLRISWAFPLTPGGWIARVYRVKHPNSFCGDTDKPIIFTPGKKPFVHSQKSFVYTQDPYNLLRERFCVETPRQRVSGKRKLIPLDSSGMVVKSRKQSGNPGEENKDYFVIALRTFGGDVEHDIMATLYYTIFALTGLDTNKGGLVIVEKSTRKVIALDIQCSNTKFSCDGATLMTWKGNIVTIIDNPFLS